MRLTDKTILHPAFRQRLVDLEARLIAENIPLYLFEGARTPWRQAELFARGRSLLGVPIVTKAQPWLSFHQYGLASDYVFKVNRGWSWDEPEKGMWNRYQELAGGVGLDVLSFEKPHVQFPWSLRDLRRGLFPPNGDSTWLRWLGHEMERWGSFEREHAGLSHPGAPPMIDIEARPEVS